MPHRRTIKKGSFGGHFDELVPQFPHEASHDKGAGDKLPRKDRRHINDRLIESVWGETRHKASEAVS